jgi:amino acid transporter
MKPQTNTSKRERLAKWQAVHKQLLQDDAQYRKRHTSFLITIVCLSCIMLPFFLPFFGIRLFGFAVNVSIISCVAATIVFLALRQLQFQNQRIQSFLQSSHDA